MSFRKSAILRGAILSIAVGALVFPMSGGSMEGVLQEDSSGNLSTVNSLEETVIEKSEKDPLKIEKIDSSSTPPNELLKEFPIETKVRKETETPIEAERVQSPYPAANSHEVQATRSTEGINRNPKPAGEPPLSEESGGNRESVGDKKSSLDKPQQKASQPTGSEKVENKNRAKEKSSKSKGKNKSKKNSSVHKKSKPKKKESIVGSNRLKAGEGSSVVWRGSGYGFVTLKTQHDPSSASPGMPTIVSLMCDGRPVSVYKGAFNTTNIDGVITKRIPYAGKDCRMIAKVSQSSKKWHGTSSWIYYTVHDTKLRNGGNYHAKTIPWNSRAITSSRTFSYGDQTGFEGFVVLKLTTCSTNGGSTDSTIKNGCNGLVNKSANGKYRVEVFDDSGKIADNTHYISYRRHHDMFTYETGRKVRGNLRVKVTPVSGLAVIVHGDGSSLIGLK